MLYMLHSLQEPFDIETLRWIRTNTWGFTVLRYHHPLCDLFAILRMTTSRNRKYEY
jgi:hypothetical protein